MNVQEHPSNESLEVGLITTWNTKCGVANYSKYLVRHTPPDARIRYTIFARKEDVLVGKDEANVTRCWLNHGSTEEVVHAIESRDIQLVHIMFNSSFFTASQLGNLIMRLRARQVEVAVTIHDPIETLKDITTELSLAKTVVVFREDDVRQLREFGVLTEAVSIPQGILAYPDQDRRIARQLHGVVNSKVIASTGFLLPDKGVLEVIQAIPALLSAHPDILYVVVCSVNLDSASEQYYAQCKDEVRRLNLGEHVTFEVDYREEEEVMALLHMADMILMPRKHTVQPTSAALRFALSALRPVITTHAPIFGDFGPEVYKIADCDPMLIASGVNRLYADAALCNAMMEAARQRIATDSWGSISRKYADISWKRHSSAEVRLTKLVQNLSQTVEQLREDLQAAQQEFAEDKKSLQSRLQQVYSSCSWRITAPLRDGGRLPRAIARVLGRGVVSGASFLLRHPRLRRPVGRLLAAIVRHRRLLQFGSRILARFPSLRLRLNWLIVGSSAPVQPKAAARRPRRQPRLAPSTVGLTPYSSGQALLHGGARPIYYWVDDTVGQPSNTGMQRVTRCLARGLIELGTDLVAVCWDEDEKTLTRATKSELAHLSKWNGPQLSTDFLASYPGEGEPWAPLHEQVSPEMMAGAWLLVPEVTHITPQAQAPTLDVIDYAKAHGMKTAFVFYDAIPLKLDEYAGTGQQHADYMQHIALADAIIPISEYCGKDLTDFYREQLNFHNDTLPAIRPVLLPMEFYDTPRATDYRVPGDEAFVLCVGTIEPRKNQTALLKAFQNICDRYADSLFKLVLVGNVDARTAPVLDEAIRRNPRIEHPGYVDDNTLIDLYRRCSFTVFPSVEEGYGLPIAESLWHGKPVICADFGSMEEVARGGGCLTVDVRSAAELEAALERMIFDGNLRARLGAEAVARPASSWKKYATDVMAVLRDIDNPARRIANIYYFVEHTSTFPINSGIQRVTRGLARALQEAGVPLIPVKWDPSSQSFYDPDEAEVEHLSKWNGPYPERFSCLPDTYEREPNSWLLVPELTAYRAGPDLNVVAEVAKKRELKTAVVFYDAIPYKLSQMYTTEATSLHREYMNSLVNFDLIFPISLTSMKDLQAFLFHSVDRLTNFERKLIPVSLPGELSERPRGKVSEEGQSGRIRILCVSVIEQRKNHIGLLESFDRISRRSTLDIELVLVGKCFVPELQTKVESFLKENDRITWLREISDEALAQEYSRCSFSVYPSIEEGFGLPIVESLWHGKPCICRNSGAMAEVAEGGGCLTVDTTNVDELARAITLLAQDKELRAKLGQEAVTRRLKTWSEYAYEILQHLASDATE